MAQEQISDGNEVIKMVTSHLPQVDETNIIPVTRLEWLIVNQAGQFYVGYDDNGPAFSNIQSSHAFLTKDEAVEEIQVICDHFEYRDALLAIGVRDDDVCQVQK